MRQISRLRKARIVFLAVLLLFAGSLSLRAWVLGRMTGGGSFFTPDGVRITHGFELYCQQNGGTPPLIGPNNLEVNWDGGHFHLDVLTSNGCLGPPPEPAPPKAPISIYNACGDGSFNGVSGYHACWSFVDAGEPGTNDTAWFALYSPDYSSTIIYAPPAPLMYGNHQAHFVTGGKLKSLSQ